MSEGELKKRLSTRLYNCLEVDYMPIEDRVDKEEIEEHASIKWVFVKQLLDEAAKEWVDLDEYFEEERSEVARAWFKKWFGEKK